MPSIAQQSVTELGGPRSVLSRQRRDHVELDRLLRELSACAPEQAGPLLVRVYRLVFPHAFAEEAVLWPAIRRLLPDGHELTLQVEREHQEINELVTAMEQEQRGSPAWQELLDRTVLMLSKDVRDEEDELLPRLQQAATTAELRWLGFMWEMVRLVAPTRPHPIVSRRPPGNVLSALPLTIVDRARDRVDLWRYQNGRTGSSVAAALTRMAHRIERAPGLQSGEDPQTRVAPRSRLGWKSAAVAGLAFGGAIFFARRKQRLNSIG